MNHRGRNRGEPDTLKWCVGVLFFCGCVCAFHSISGGVYPGMKLPIGSSQACEAAKKEQGSRIIPWYRNVKGVLPVFSFLLSDSNKSSLPPPPPQLCPPRLPHSNLTLIFSVTSLATSQPTFLGLMWPGQLCFLSFLRFFRSFYLKLIMVLPLERASSATPPPTHPLLITVWDGVRLTYSHFYSTT